MSIRLQVQLSDRLADMFREPIDIRAGRLLQLCPEWDGEEVPLYLVCADRRQLSPAVRLLREFLEDRCPHYAVRHPLLDQPL